VNNGKEKKEKSGKKIDEKKHPLPKSLAMAMVERHPEDPRYTGILIKI